MDPETKLKDSHDISQALQRKLEGLADVERAFVHVDYEYDHNVNEEHRPLYGAEAPIWSIRKIFHNLFQAVKGFGKSKE
jgi:hypothetical protein